MKYRLSVKKTSTSGYSCEYCGDYHRSFCDDCNMPPCRCRC